MNVNPGIQFFVFSTIFALLVIAIFVYRFITLKKRKAQKDVEASPSAEAKAAGTSTSIPRIVVGSTSPATQAVQYSKN